MTMTTITMMMMMMMMMMITIVMTIKMITMMIITIKKIQYSFIYSFIVIMYRSYLIHGPHWRRFP